MIILSIFIASLILWVFWIATANLVTSHQDTLGKGVKGTLIQWFMYVFVACNILYNFTYNAVFFWEWASFDRPTISQRMIHILETRNQDEWRWKRAYWVCRYLIDPFDRGHCKMKFTYEGNQK